MFFKIKILFFISVCIFSFSVVYAKEKEIVKGIYISQPTLENTKYLNYLIENSKKVGINTFVVDFYKLTKQYQKNILLVKNNHLNYVVRIVMFPGGGRDEQIRSQAYWEKKYQLVKEAIALGADAVQLDYVRYQASEPASPQNAQNIYRIIKWFKQRLDIEGVPLQIDVFGISSFAPSKHIGQDIALFADSIDTLCPMLYPSHFEPYKKHALQPYRTVFDSLESIKKQFSNGKTPFDMYAYIEIYNYRHQYAAANSLAYLQEQIRAVEDADIEGWYAWSANNYYNKLFRLLSMYPKKPIFDANLERSRGLG